MDGRTYGRTDTSSYKDARMHRKSEKVQRANHTRKQGRIHGHQLHTVGLGQ